MQDVLRDIGKVVMVIGSKDVAAQEAAFIANYLPRTRFTHPFLLMEFRQEIIDVYWLLSKLNWNMYPKINATAYDSFSSVAFVDVVQSYRLLALPLLKLKVELVIVFNIQRVPATMASPARYFISEQHDVVDLPSLLFRVPVIGPLYHGAVRRVVGCSLACAGRILTKFGFAINLIRTKTASTFKLSQ